MTLAALTLLLGCAVDAAEPTVDPDPVPEVAQDVSDAREQVEDIQIHLTAVERFLADKVALQEGRKPKGWILPPLSSYERDAQSEAIADAATPAPSTPDEQHTTVIP